MSKETDAILERLGELKAEARESLRLMREYTEKLREWTAHAEQHFPANWHLTPEQQVVRQAIIADHRDRLMRIQPAFSDLSGIASGLVEGSDLDYLLRTEVRLRLAEFENAMERYRLLVDSPDPSSKPTTSRRPSKVR